MVDWHMKSKHKVSGGISRTARRSDKRLAWKGGEFLGAVVHPEFTENDVRIKRGRGGKSEKFKMAYAKYANVAEPATNKIHKAMIETVVLNPANQHYTRRNIITKGAILELTVKGKKHLAKVTSKPGRAGAVNAVLFTDAEAKEFEQKQQEAKKKKTKKKKEKPEKTEKKEKSEAEIEKEADEIIKQAEKQEKEKKK